MLARLGPLRLNCGRLIAVPKIRRLVEAVEDLTYIQLWLLG
jgi:hypothetical protein